MVTTDGHDSGPALIQYVKTWKRILRCNGQQQYCIYFSHNHSGKPQTAINTSERVCWMLFRLTTKLLTIGMELCEIIIRLVYRVYFLIFFWSRSISASRSKLLLLLFSFPFRTNFKRRQKWRQQQHGTSATKLSEPQTTLKRVAGVKQLRGRRILLNWTKMCTITLIKIGIMNRSKGAYYDSQKSTVIKNKKVYAINLVWSGWRYGLGEVQPKRRLQ